MHSQRSAHRLGQRVDERLVDARHKLVERLRAYWLQAGPCGGSTHARARTPQASTASAEAMTATASEERPDESTLRAVWRGRVRRATQRVRRGACGANGACYALGLSGVRQARGAAV